MTDDEIIGRCLRGDVASFREIVERYQKKIIGMTYNMTHDHHLSEDLCQEVFLEVYRRLGTFDRARAQFSTWLYRIAQNKTLNALKRKRPQFVATLPEAADPNSVQSEIDAHELHLDFDRALEKLPAAQKIAFVWAEIEQLSYHEIAEIERTTVSAVKSRINRARQAIQAALSTRCRHDPT